jgi:hypothetical protein
MEPAGEPRADPGSLAGSPQAGGRGALIMVDTGYVRRVRQRLEAEEARGAGTGQLDGDGKDARHGGIAAVSACGPNLKVHSVAAVSIFKPEVCPGPGAGGEKNESQGTTT